MYEWILYYIIKRIGRGIVIKIMMVPKIDILFWFRFEVCSRVLHRSQRFTCISGLKSLARVQVFLWRMFETVSASRLIAWIRSSLKLTFWRILSVFYTSLDFPRMFLFHFSFFTDNKSCEPRRNGPTEVLIDSTLRFYWFVLFFKESHLVWAFDSFLCICACIFKVVAEFCKTVLRCIPL